MEMNFGNPSVKREPFSFAGTGLYLKRTTWRFL